jgi:hypothetical protein
MTAERCDLTHCADGRPGTALGRLDRWNKKPPDGAGVRQGERRTESVDGQAKPDLCHVGVGVG